MRWDGSEKLITDISSTSVNYSQDPSAFALPRRTQFSFTYEDLFMSVGRTQMLSTARTKLSLEERVDLVRDISVALMTHIDIFVQAGPDFAFSERLEELADEARSSLASKVGAAVADRVMEASGYKFRANAKDVRLSRRAGSTSSKIPDFVYDEVGATGRPPWLVIVEAKGSLSPSRAERSRLGRWALSAYREQVQDLIGETANGVRIDGGCAAAFGAIPGAKQSSVAIRACSIDVIVPPAGAPAAIGHQVAHSLSAAATPRSHMQAATAQQQRIQENQHQHVQQQVPSGRGGGGSGFRDGGRPRGGPGAHGLTALANYEANFLLCGALVAARRIRGLLDNTKSHDKEQTQEFLVSETHPNFLFFKTAFAPCWATGHLAVYKPAAEVILQAVAGSSSPPRFLDVPGAPPTSEPGILIQADGLAWVSKVSGSPKSKVWDLNKGGWR